MRSYDYLIVGSGIIGLALARELKRRYPDRTIAIIEKEADVAYHASGRNSGVLHAGFYYTADSLKARFTREGNQAMTRYCEEHGLAINKCGKVVVATNEEELRGLHELKRRGDRNGVELQWVTERELADIDPNIKTYQRALYSPTTSTVNPVEVCQKMKEEITALGVDLYFNSPYLGWEDGVVRTASGPIACGYLINAAGLYADKIAHEFGFGKKFTIIPFKGIYLKYAKNQTDLSTNVYPVPNLRNPFLGVHYTKTVDGAIKIGPTAIPAFWRENYGGMHRFKLGEFLSIMGYEAKLFLKNSFNFRSLAIEEMKKYRKSYFVGLSMKMVQPGTVDQDGFGSFLRPGIRAQLLNKETLELVQDFVIEGDEQSMHVLNAVSPAFTCSIPFAKYVADAIEEKQGRAAEQAKQGGHNVEAG